MDDEHINTALNDSIEYSEKDNDFFDPVIFFS